MVAVGYDDALIGGKILFNNPFPGPSAAIEQRMDANIFVRNITAAAGSVQGYRYAVGGED